MDVPDWEEHHRSILALADLIRRRLPLLTSQPELVARQCAAGYLARCRRLLLAADQLRVDFPDAVGALLRPMFETWLTATWLVLAPEEALPALENDYTVEVEQMTRLASIETDQVDETWRGDLQSPRVASLAVRVGRLLVEAGDPGGDQLEWSYNLVHRNESIYSVHGGLGPTLAHLTHDADRVGVLETRTGDGDGTGRVLWAGILLGILARRVFVMFGIGVGEIDNITFGLEQPGRDLNETVKPASSADHCDPEVPERMFSSARRVRIRIEHADISERS
jgi:hypothetical protein